MPKCFWGQVAFWRPGVPRCLRRQGQQKHSFLENACFGLGTPGPNKNRLAKQPPRHPSSKIRLGYYRNLSMASPVRSRTPIGLRSPHPLQTVAREGLSLISRIVEKKRPNRPESSRGRWPCGRKPPVKRQLPLPEIFLHVCVFSGP